MSDAPSLAFHAASPEGEGVVVLLERGAGSGQVRFTEWQAGAYHLPGRAGEAPAADLLARVEGWRRAGWRFSEAPPRIQDWLRGPPAP